MGIRAFFGRKIYVDNGSCSLGCNCRFVLSRKEYGLYIHDFVILFPDVPRCNNSLHGVYYVKGALTCASVIHSKHIYSMRLL